jgi:hypothetical protein
MGSSHGAICKTLTLTLGARMAFELQIPQLTMYAQAPVHPAIATFINTFFRAKGWVLGQFAHRIRAAPYGVNRIYSSTPGA